jgi:hypothetical protein
MLSRKELRIRYPIFPFYVNTIYHICVDFIDSIYPTINGLFSITKLIKNREICIYYFFILNHG